MPTIDIHEAKARYARAVQAAAENEATVHAGARKATPRSMPIDQEKRVLRFGGLRGKIFVADDFDAPLPDDLLDAFEGR
jgi:hypothetical protein